MIGITMRYGLFLSTPGTAGNAALLNAYGSVENIMLAYQKLGVQSIELSCLHTHLPIAEMIDICRRIQRTGLHLTLHGTTENISGAAHFDFFAPLYEEILRHQRHTSVTLHAPSDLSKAISIPRDWCQEGLKRFPSLLFVIENQRLRLPEHGEHFKINAIPPTLPETENVGICWDMGHYAYNILKDGLPIKTLPAPETLKRIRHTHIHGIENMDTHYPLQGDPVTTYVKALQNSDYSGIYNLEIVPDKFMKAKPDVKHEIEKSIILLKEMLGRH